MHRRLLRAFVAATVLCTLLLPTAGSFAGPHEQLDQTQKELDSLREQIEQHQAEAGSLRERIDALNSDITKLHLVINRLDVRIAKVRAEVRAVQADIDRTKAKIARIEHAATEQATALYKSGSTDALDALLDTKSLTELNDRIEMLGVAAQENTGALIRFSRLRARLERQNQALFAKQEELTATLAQKQEVLAQRDALRDQLADDLDALQKRIGSEKAREGNLESKAAQLEDRIAELQARALSAPGTTVSSAASLGTSSAGFIWPLNGSITSGYGSRWGRMHTGIDIDGVSGQPIVAAKSGRVIMAGAYSGYGNAVIIDHGGGISTLYGHMSGFATSSGAGVGQGQVIGYVGCTGSCTGDHLHFEVRVNGSPVDPMGYLP